MESDDRIISFFAEAIRTGATDRAAALEELCRRHPEHAAPFRHLFAAWMDLEEFVGEDSIEVGGEWAASDIDLEAAGEDASDARFKVREPLGQGGMGSVHRTWDERLRREVAVKVAEKRSTVRDLRFIEEAQVMAQLEHPGVVPVYDLGVTPDGRLFYSMQVVKGHTFEDVIRFAHSHTDGWNLPRAVDVLVKVCDAVGFAHRKGVVHRDIKPSNVMVGGFGQVYVMDWGLARLRRPRSLGERRDDREARAATSDSSTTSIDSDRKRAIADDASPFRTADGAVLGTPAYMAPEQARGSEDGGRPPVDVYAVGAMLYHLLTGIAPYSDQPWDGDLQRLIERAEAGPPTDPAEVRAGIPAELSSICRKAMAPSPNDRYSTVGGLRDDLRAHLEDRVVEAWGTGTVAEVRKWVRRNRALTLTAAIAVLAALAGIAGVVIKDRLARIEVEAMLGKLQSTNLELTQQSTLAQRSAEREVEARKRAEAARYAAQVRAAMGAIEAGQVAAARRFLAACTPQLRGWEWDFTSARLDGSRITLAIDDGADVRSVLVHAGSILTGHDSGLVRRWSAATGALEAESEIGSSVFALVYDSSSESVLAGDLRGAVLSLDPETLAVRSSELAHPEPSAHLFDIAPSPTGPEFVSVASDGRVVLWSSPTGPRRDLLAIEGLEPRVFSADWSGDGSTLAVLANDFKLRLIDPDDGSVLAERDFDTPDKTMIHAVRARFDPSGRTLAVGWFDGSIYVVDAETLELRRVLEGHSGIISSLTFDPSGSDLLSTSYDSTARVWEYESGRTVQVARGHTGHVFCGSFLDDGRSMITAGARGEAKLWSTQPRPSPRILGGGGNNLALDSTGRRLATTGRHGWTVVWDLESGEELLRIDSLHAWGAAVAWYGDHVLIGCTDGAVLALDSDGGEISLIATIGLGEIETLVVDPDEATLIAGCYRGAAAVDLVTGVATTIPGIEGHCRDACAIGSGQVAILDGASTRLVDVATLEVRSAPTERTAVGTAIHAAADHQRVAVADETGRIRVWESSTWTLKADFQAHSASILGLAFSPGAARLASASVDSSVRLWDPTSGDEVLSLLGNGFWVFDVQFDPSGQSLITSSDKTRVFSATGAGD